MVTKYSKLSSHRMTSWSGLMFDSATRHGRSGKIFISRNRIIGQFDKLMGNGYAITFLPTNAICDSTSPRHHHCPASPRNPQQKQR